jgi:two-component system, NarL family, nitrate/nitrite response regulator NarL
MQIVPVVIIGRREFLREGIAALLQDSPYEVVASAASASQLKAVGDLARRRAMVILAIEDEDARIVETTKSIKVLISTFPDSKLVVVAQMLGPLDVLQVAAMAPDGYIANVGSREVLLNVLELTLSDQTVIVTTPLQQSLTSYETELLYQCPSPPSSSDLEDFHHLPRGKNAALSPREREVLLHLANGSSNKVIARVCNITESTGVQNRTQAALWAARNNPSAE